VEDGPIIILITIFQGKATKDISYSFETQVTKVRRKKKSHIGWQQSSGAWKIVQEDNKNHPFEIRPGKTL